MTFTKRLIVTKVNMFLQFLFCLVGGLIGGLHETKFDITWCDAIVVFKLLLTVRASYLSETLHKQYKTNGEVLLRFQLKSQDSES